MTVENYGSVWQIGHCLPIASFNLLNENDLKNCFNWINLNPCILKKKKLKKAKIDHRLYLMQEVKAIFFETKCPRKIILNLILMKYMVNV